MWLKQWQQNNPCFGHSAVTTWHGHRHSNVQLPIWATTPLKYRPMVGKLQVALPTAAKPLVSCKYINDCLVQVCNTNTIPEAVCIFSSSGRRLMRVDFVLSWYYFGNAWQSIRRYWSDILLFVPEYITRRSNNDSNFQPWTVEIRPPQWHGVSGTVCVMLFIELEIWIVTCQQNIWCNSHSEIESEFLMCAWTNFNQLIVWQNMISIFTICYFA